MGRYHKFVGRLLAFNERVLDQFAIKRLETNIYRRGLRIYRHGDLYGESQRKVHSGLLAKLRR